MRSHDFFDTQKNGSHREEWLPVFNRNESLMSSISVDGPCSDRWEISAHDVTIHEKLGEGEFGEVFKGEIYSEPSKGQCGLPQQQVAVKLLKSLFTRYCRIILAFDFHFSVGLANVRNT